MFAPKHINEYYTRCKTNKLPRIASEIAKDLTDEFWNLEESNDFRKKYQISALKRKSYWTFS